MAAYTASDYLNMIAEIDSALLVIAQSGKEYTIFGTRKVTKADIGDLIKLKNHAKRQYLRLTKKWTGRVTPDFSGM